MKMLFNKSTAFFVIFSAVAFYISGNFISDLVRHFHTNHVMSDIKTKYRWTERKTGEKKCVAQEPGKEAVPCSWKDHDELKEYNVRWITPSAELIAIAQRESE